MHYLLENSIYFVLPEIFFIILVFITIVYFLFLHKVKVLCKKRNTGLRLDYRYDELYVNTFFNYSALIIIGLFFVVFLIFDQLQQFNGSLIETLNGENFFILGGGEYYCFNNSFKINRSICLAKLIIIMTLISLVGVGSYRKNSEVFEFFPIILLAGFGMFVLVSANDFIVTAISLEIQTFSFLILAVDRRKKNLSNEAGIKYYIVSALASSLILFGTALIYSETAFINFTDLTNFLILSKQSDTLALNKTYFGFLMVLVGLCLKLGVPPFHIWVPEVYAGVPTPVTVIYATIPKMPLIFLIIKMFHIISGGPFHYFQSIYLGFLSCIIIYALFIGTFGAFLQEELKKILAFSGMTHIAFLLMGLLSNNPDGIKAIFIYTIIYFILSLSFFTALLILKKSNTNIQIRNLHHLRDLYYNYPILAVNICLTFFSLLGVPPLIGFFGKFFVLKALMEQHVFIALFAVIMSGFSAFYYLRFIRYLMFDNNNRTRKVQLYEEVPFAASFILAITTTINLTFFLKGHWIIAFINDNLLSENFINLFS